MKVATIQDKENESLSPMYIFGTTIEFNGYKFISPYIFFQALKIPEEENRQEFLNYYLEIKNLKELYTLKKSKFSYTKKFNKEPITQIVINGESVDATSTQIDIYLKNMYTILAAVSPLFKYSYSVSKRNNMEFDDFQFSNIDYITGDRLNKILKM